MLPRTLLGTGSRLWRERAVALATEFPGVKLLPSEYFKRQMGATFMYEPAGLAAAYRFFGADCLYWSTDFPHPATSWPHSRDVIARELGHLPKEILRKVVRDNVIKLYDLKIDGINN